MGLKEDIKTLEEFGKSDPILKELNLRRDFMQNLPLCPDHRDKVKGLSCLKCRIERLERTLEQLADRSKDVLQSKVLIDDDLEQLRNATSLAERVLNDGR